MGGHNARRDSAGGTEGRKIDALPLRGRRLPRRCPEPAADDPDSLLATLTRRSTQTTRTRETSQASPPTGACNPLDSGVALPPPATRTPSPSQPGAALKAVATWPPPPSASRWGRPVAVSESSMAVDVRRRKLISRDHADGCSTPVAPEPSRTGVKARPIVALPSEARGHPGSAE